MNNLSTVLPIFAESTTPVPEPTTIILLGSGLLALAGYGRLKFLKKRIRLNLGREGQDYYGPVFLLNFFGIVNSKVKSLL